MKKAEKEQCKEIAALARKSFEVAKASLEIAAKAFESDNLKMKEIGFDFAQFARLDIRAAEILNDTEEIKAMQAKGSLDKWLENLKFDLMLEGKGQAIARKAIIQNNPELWRYE